jgi:hypothetical protein
LSDAHGAAAVHGFESEPEGLRYTEGLCPCAAAALIRHTATTTALTRARTIAAVYKLGPSDDTTSGARGLRQVYTVV